MNANLYNLKKRIFEIIQIGKEQDLLSKIFDWFITLVIISNIAAMYIGTFSFSKNYIGILSLVESITVSIFVVEYILRLWTASFLYSGEKNIIAIIKFIFSFDGIIDLLTILPFFFLSGFVAFRMLRVVRIFHLFRINANYDSFNVIKSVLYEKKNQLLSSLFIIVMLIMASSLFLYSAEHEAQPENFRNAFSGIWWSVSTLLTVGYGDVYPITIAGKMMAIVITFLGVGAVAIPTGIVSAGFVEQYTRASSSSSLDLNIQNVVIDIDSKWIGLSVTEVKDEFNVNVILAQRDNAIIVPNDDYKIAFKDSLAVYIKED